MIIDYSINSKTYKENILDFKGSFPWKCPTCGARHSLTRHATYFRNLVSLRDGILEEEKLCILRLKCNSCTHTHAILPFDVVPFLVYSGSTVLTICSMVFLENHSTKKIGKALSLSYQLIYGFLKRLLSFLAPITLFLRQFHLWNRSVSPDEKEIFDCFSEFSHTQGLFQSYLYYHRYPLFLIRRCSSSYLFWTGF